FRTAATCASGTCSASDRKLRKDESGPGKKGLFSQLRGAGWAGSDCSFALLRSDLKGPAVPGRPLRSMSPGLRLRLRPPPLLTRKDRPASTGLGLSNAVEPSLLCCGTYRTTAYFEASGGGAL